MTCTASGLDLTSFTTCATGACNINILGAVPCSRTSVPSCPITNIQTTPPTFSTTTTKPPTTLDFSTITTLERTSVAPGTSVALFCISKGVTSPRRFPYGSGCKQYVYCYLTSNALKAKLYTCAGKSMFDPITSECVPKFECTS